MTAGRGGGSYRVLAMASLVFIVFLLAMCLSTLSRIFQEPALDSRMATVLVVVMLIIGTANLFTNRLSVMPAIVRAPEGGLDGALAVGYTFATAPAIYGVIAVTFTDRGLLTLPFTALAGMTWLTTWLYQQEREPSPPAI